MNRPAGHPFPLYPQRVYEWLPLGVARWLTRARVPLGATTSQNWTAELHRHIVGRDDCLDCRFGDLPEARSPVLRTPSQSPRRRTDPPSRKAVCLGDVDGMDGRTFCLDNMDSYERIRQLRDDYESALDEAERLRVAYHREIVKLHRSGASLREIADGLGMSHQRVHQIVSPHEDKQRSRKKTTVIAGPVSTVLILALGGVLVVSSLRVPDRPTSRATPSPRAEAGVPPAVTFGCPISPKHESTSTAITIAAECQRHIEGILGGRRSDIGLIALDPHAGRIIAVVSSASPATPLQDAT